MVSSRCSDIIAWTNKASFIAREKTSDAQGVFFEVPVKRKG